MTANSLSRSCAVPGVAAVQGSPGGRYPGAPGKHRGRHASCYPGAPGKHRRLQEKASQDTVLAGTKAASW